ncbi:hypothetical protein EG359_01120 [Chryseobacterium joostei]|uniref:Uncharacterized protein n=1 Tax=Chryseobacterium joostei TaxID=112234 RepID=A0A1N7IRK3_9FLAO|nr:hypothetical protein [Chryseobacterium joostei]AZA98287.1 hypothetical protein EG359_01120 [Chryseobacterium joostei]SIS39729.1 hypothetical protein SAMN05421768_106302 [Chryseobacterium joostei]
MGHEYKITAKLTQKQRSEIAELLENNRYFYERDEKVVEFRHPENNGKMPNLYVGFEPDGLYVCQNGSSYLWTYLDDLKEYFEKEIVDFEIIDYSE